MLLGTGLVLIADVVPWEDVALWLPIVVGALVSLAGGRWAVGRRRAQKQLEGRTRDALGARFDSLFGRLADEAMLVELEETLLTSDVGLATTARVLDGLKARVRAGTTDGATLRAGLRDDLRGMLNAVAAPFGPAPAEGPFVILVVGVNGSGKTTTIGKLAAKFVKDGKKVLMVAGDTFRAAAAEQLTIWAERAGADIVRQTEGADPAAGRGRSDHRHGRTPPDQEAPDGGADQGPARHRPQGAGRAPRDAAGT